MHNEVPPIEVLCEADILIVSRDKGDRLGSRAFRLALSLMVFVPRYERRHGSSKGRFRRRGNKYLDKNCSSVVIL